MIAFKIGKHKDEVLCDVVPMEASHIFFGNGVQYGRNVIHDGFKNKYSFQFKDKSITLVSFSPQQVMEDQQKIHGKAERKINERKKRDEGLIEEEQVERLK